MFVSSKVHNLEGSYVGDLLYPESGDLGPNALHSGVIVLCDLKSLPLSRPCLSNGERANPPTMGYC